MAAYDLRPIMAAYDISVQQKKVTAVALAVCFVVLRGITTMTPDRLIEGIATECAVHSFLQEPEAAVALNGTAPLRQQPLSAGATLVLELQCLKGRDGDDDDDVKSVSTGWHKAHVIFEDSTNCPDPHFGVRLAGSKAALVPVLLTQSSLRRLPRSGPVRSICPLMERIVSSPSVTAVHWTRHCTKIPSKRRRLSATTIRRSRFVVVGPTTFPSMVHG